MELTCASCGIVFTWQPTVVGAAIFCCVGCAEGGPCTCDYSRLPRRSDHTALAVGKPGASDPTAGPLDSAQAAGDRTSQISTAS